MEKKRHIGLFLLGLWNVLGALLYFLAGAVILIFGIFIKAIIGDAIPFAGLGVTIIAAIFIILGIIYLIIAYGLFKERKWAFYTEFVLIGIMFILALLSLSIIGIIIDGAILFYLWHIHAEINPEYCAGSSFLCRKKEE